MDSAILFKDGDIRSVYLVFLVSLVFLVKRPPRESREGSQKARNVVTESLGNWVIV